MFNNFPVPWCFRQRRSPLLVVEQLTRSCMIINGGGGEEQLLFLLLLLPTMHNAHWCTKTKYNHIQLFLCFLSTSLPKPYQ
jgi:hypothetical protein